MYDCKVLEKFLLHHLPWELQYNFSSVQHGAQDWLLALQWVAFWPRFCNIYLINIVLIYIRGLFCNPASREISRGIFQRIYVWKVSEFLLPLAFSFSVILSKWWYFEKQIYAGFLTSCPVSVCHSLLLRQLLLLAGFRSVAFSSLFRLNFTCNSYSPIT